MKWVAQMPNPLAVAATPSQICRIWPVDRRTWWTRLIAVKRGQCADDRRKHDQPQIVFLNDAGVDFEHGATV